MSKKIINPNFYKIGGREHAEGHGEAIPHEDEKQQFAQAEKQTQMQGKEGQPNFIPGEAPVGQKSKKK